MKKKDLLQTTFTNELIPVFNILNGIRDRSEWCSDYQITNKKFDDLYSLFHKKEIFIQAYGNIRKNKGSLTKGVDGETVDSMSLIRIEKLVKKFKDNIFRFRPVRRIYIPKPGKKKLRPLGIPVFTDRLVQEVIRMILDSIYEPVFEKTNTNFGFRRGKGTHHAMNQIKRKGAGSTFAIEGDIVGAYDNVRHNKLMEILSRRISDFKFLKLIKDGLQCGMVENWTFKQTLLGTPQGGIASPILFNIYMHEFDSYIKNEFNEFVNKYNDENGRFNKKPTDTIYQRYNSRVFRARKKYNNIKSNKPWNEKDPFEKHNLKLTLRILKENIRERLKRPSIDVSRRPVSFSYIRYADDWILITNGNRKFCQVIKTEIAKFLLDNLGFELSAEKTLITNLKTEVALFVGFEIRTSRFRRFSRSSFGDCIRDAGWSLRFNIDKVRMLNRLASFGFCILQKNYRPKAKDPYAVLKIEEIINRFNYMIRGVANYYLPVIDLRNVFNRIHYIYYYSCMGTIAKKTNSSIFKVIKKYGNPLIYKIESPEAFRLANPHSTKGNRIYKLITYLDCIESSKLRRENFKKGIVYSVSSDIFNAMNTINWRTYRDLTSVCAICGTDKNVEMHHVRAVRKGKVTGFTQVMNQLNRKMIPLCREHHMDVEFGRYDGAGVNDLLDIERFLM